MEHMLPGILYGVYLEEDDLGLRRGSLVVKRSPDQLRTEVSFGRRVGEHGTWEGIELARITHGHPISEPSPGVAMLIDYGEGHTYSVGRDICQSSNHHARLIFCLAHIIDKQGWRIAEWMSLTPLPDEEELEREGGS